MSQWIKCSDRMPEEGEDVIVYDDLNKSMKVFIYDMGSIFVGVFIRTNHHIMMKLM